MSAKPVSIAVQDEEYGTVTIPLRGVASVAPRIESTRTEADCTTRPMTVREARGLFARRHVIARRRAVMSAARVIESARQRQRDAALAALSAFLCPSQPVARFDGCVTRADQLERLYSEYRQARRESASLMQRKPHEGRPPMVGTAAGTAANAQEVRGSLRWTGTSRRLRDQLTRRDGSPFEGECISWNANHPSITPRVFAPVIERKTSRKPRVSTRKVTAGTVRKARAV